MDRATIEIYEASSARYEAQRNPRHRPQAEALGARTTGLAVDLGSGPGWYTDALGRPAVALDAALAMLRRTREVAPSCLPVQADLLALPFRPGSLGGGWARNTYVHLRSADVPAALADLHRALALDAPVELTFFGRPDRPAAEVTTEVVEGGPGNALAAAGPGAAATGPSTAGNGPGPTSTGPSRGLGPAPEVEGRAVFPDDDLPGRWFSTWSEERLRDVIVGAGLALDELAEERTDHYVGFTVRARRARTLPDTVGPGMRLLVCGLNPSLHAADAGVGFVTPGNRFWPAALEAGLVGRDRDPRHALAAHRVGMTDLVKRASPRAAELTRDEYGAGLERLERLCAWLEPAAVCMVGLAGWRAAADRRARAGWQSRSLGGSPVYVMPSTSGLNAATSLADLTDHLRRATTPPQPPSDGT